jgi:hypothetical protein
VSCTSPLDFEILIAYWLGELPAEREAAVEEHFFGCAHCSGRLEELAALADGIRAAVHDGKVHVVVSAPFVDAMKQAGLRLREYRLHPGGSVNCTIRADDDAVVSRMRAPLGDVKRLDVVTSVDESASERRLTDVPFDADSGEVLILPSAAWLKAMPAFTMRMRLVAVDGDNERPLGEYTFNHSPS